MSFIHYVLHTSIKNMIADRRQYKEICANVEFAKKEFQTWLFANVKKTDRDILHCQNTNNNMTTDIRIHDGYKLLDAYAEFQIKASRTMNRRLAETLAVSTICMQDIDKDATVHYVMDDVEEVNAKYQRLIESVLYPQCERVTQNGADACNTCKWTELNKQYVVYDEKFKRCKEQKNNFWKTKFGRTK